MALPTLKELKAAVAAIPEEYDDRIVQLEGCDCWGTWCGHVHVDKHGAPYFELTRSDYCSDAPEEEPDYS